MMFTFHADPGHGWLEVPRQLLHDLGIADQITFYSYQKDEQVFLEEDVDATTFARALEESGEKLSATWVHEDPTPIRNYQSYEVRK